MLTIEHNIKVQKVQESKLGDLDPKNLKFGKDFSDHMFVTKFREGKWGDGEIIPYGNISISPGMSSLHYGQSIFEGMKAYKGKDGKVRLFRPYENAKRFNVSAQRMCMPEIPEDLFVNALRELVRLDSDWIPNAKGCSLYIRPFMFGDETFLGVKAASEYAFMIICSPASSYYPEPINVRFETKYSRASRGGVGYAKAAGNYAAAMKPTQLAIKDGFHQLIWTDSVEHKYIEEAGTMNLMFSIDGKLLTPSLDGQTILGGITRDSVIKVAKKLGYEVEERRISVDEVLEAYKSGRLEDAFGLGTAANIAWIKSITYEGTQMVLPEVSKRKASVEIARFLDNMKYGEIEDSFGWVDVL